MAILKIARLGHPVLTQVATPIADVHHPDMQRLINDMLETMADARGIGLAAPQIHMSLRLFVLQPSVLPLGQNELPSPPPEEAVFVNPEIDLLEGTPADGWEGCLSIPGMRAKVPRAKHLRYRAFDRQGVPFQGMAADFQARVIQHEFDHLNGVLYPMRIKDFRCFGFSEELACAGVYNV